MLIGYFSKDNIVELEDGNKIKISELKIGDCVKGANKNFNHYYENKLHCVADTKNYSYNKITNIVTKKKSSWEIRTDEGNCIICSLGTKLKTMLRSVGTNVYEMSAASILFDDFVNGGEEGYNFVMSYGFDKMYFFEPKGETDLIGIEVEKKEPIFVNNFLIG